MLWFKRLVARFFPPRTSPLPAVQKRRGIFPSVLRKAQVQTKPSAQHIMFPLEPPKLLAGVLPKDKATEVIGMDSARVYEFARSYGDGGVEGFPGYPYLAALATRAEYRAFAATISTEATREWIVLNSSETAGEETKAKVTEITQQLTKLGLQQVVQSVAEHDSYFGRGQILIDIKGHQRDKPLILSPKTIAKRTTPDGEIGLVVKAVEPYWTTPVSYNAIDPGAPNFYKPDMWFMLGQPVHATRLLTIVTRPVPDLFKPAFNFSGISMSQLAEPYVNNWLRTRQSVSDLINNFSLTILATRMDQELQGGDDEPTPENDGTNLIARADLFTALKSNKGVMLIDKETEEIVQVNTPLSGLDKLQAQAQEHMCSVSRIPAIVLTGISPTGLNASSEGEIRVFYDWVMAMLEANYRDPIDTVIKIVQLMMYGSIDPDIIFTFNPLYQMTPKELADIRKTNADAAGAYIDRGVIDSQEERERLARDPESGYQGLDINKEIEAPQEEEEGDADNEK